MPRNARPIAGIKVPAPFVVYDPVPEPLPPQNSLLYGRPRQPDKWQPVLEKLKADFPGQWCRVSEDKRASSYVQKLKKKYTEYDFASRTVGESGDRRTFLYAIYVTTPPEAKLVPATKVEPPFVPEEEANDLLHADAGEGGIHDEAR